MQNQQNPWLIFGGGLIVIIALHLAGLIGSIWSGIGIAAVISLFLATTLMKSFKKTVITILTIWTVATLIRLIVVPASSQRLQDAVASRTLGTEVRLSQTIRTDGAEAIATRYKACSEWEDRFIVTVIKPLRIDIAALPPADPQVQTKMAALKQKEQYLIKELENCVEGLPYESPPVASWWAKVNSRASATLLFVALLLSGWGLYRASPKSPWTRWVGGPLLILAFLFLIYHFFEAGLDKKVEQGVERVVWNVSTKKSPAPPPPPPPAPEKKEKKIIAAKRERAGMRRATTAEESTPRAYHVRALSGPFATPSGVATFGKGQGFVLPAMGTGGCAALIPLEGEIALVHDGRGSASAVGPGMGPISNCNNAPIVAEALTDTVVFGGACPTAADKKCLVD